MKALYKRLIGMLDGEDRRSFWIFVGISFFAGLIEVIGIGSIMPFIGLLMQPEMVHGNAVLSSIYDRMGMTGTQQFLVFMGCVTLGMIILGGIINIFTIRYQLKITYRIGHKWALRLFSSYLNQPYRFYMDVNSNAMKAAILSEVDRVVVALLIPSAVFVSKALVIMIIFVLLMFVNPAVTLLLMAIVGGIYAGLLAYFKHKMRIRGSSAIEQNKTRFQTVNEAFATIRDIKLYNNSRFFENRFETASKGYTTAQAYSLYHGQVPKFIIEMVGFVTLIGLTLFLIVRGGSSVAEVLPLIALFAASGYKVLPAAQNLYSAINSIRFHTAAFYAVAEGLDLMRGTVQAAPEKEREIRFEESIAMRDLGYSYSDRAHPALAGVNCTIRKNSLVGILGPTGSGKSTLVDILIGLLPAQEGAVMVDGVALDDETIMPWQRRIGYVPQKIYLIEGSIESNIAFGSDARPADQARMEDAARKAHIDDFIKTLPQLYQTSVGEHGDRLSGGQRQRIGIARALYRDPDILVLDEPTSALDAETARNLLASLKEISRQKTVIIITHSPDALDYCDQVLSLKNGRLQTGAA